eukprot:136212-Hanusia_phi.AAC.1
MCNEAGLHCIGPGQGRRPQGSTPQGCLPTITRTEPAQTSGVCACEIAFCVLCQSTFCWA